MKSRRTWIGLALLSAGSLALLWRTDIPLGVPGQWTWSRIPAPSDARLDLVLGWLLAAIVGAVYAAFVYVGGRTLDAAGRRQTAAWLAGLCAAAFAYLWAVQESPPGKRYDLAKAGWVLYYSGTEGYFDEARYKMRDVPSYLAAYESRMAEGDVLHFGTHPPGLILFHRTCLNLCSASPTLCDLLLQTQPASFREALDATEVAQRNTPRPIAPSDRAALWLAALLTQAVAVATIVPIYLLVRRSRSRIVSWHAAALWPLVPALAIFLPKSDALFPCLGALFLWLWLEGFRRGSLRLCALAGGVFWLAMFLSLAILPVAAAAALLTLWETFVDAHASHKRAAGERAAGERAAGERAIPTLREWGLRIGAAVAVWAVLVLFVWLAGNVNLLSVWRWNYRNHAAFYQSFGRDRTYASWLLVNPLEVIFAVGIPVMAAAVLGFRPSVQAGGRPAAAPYYCLTATWLVLWLSGKNLGEAARLWLVLFPWPVWLAAGFLAGPSHGPPTPGPPSAGPPTGPRSTSPPSAERDRSAARAGLALLALQMVVNIGTVTRVSGFDFPTLPTGSTLSIREDVPVAQAVESSIGPRAADRLHPARFVHPIAREARKLPAQALRLRPERFPAAPIAASIAK